MSDPDDLVVRWELGLCDEQDEAALVALLHDPVQRRMFVRQARIAAALACPQPETAPVRSPSRRSPKRPIRGKRQPWGWAVAASLICALGLILIQANRQAGGSRLIAASTGTQVHGLDGAVRSARAGVWLAEGETVVAGNGPVIVELAQGSARLELDADTRLRLPSPGSDRGALRLELTQGRVRAEVTKRPIEAPLSVTSPHGTAEVVGTRFALAVAEGSTRLDVTSGAVRLQGTDGQGLVIGPGQAGLAADGVVGSAPVSVEPDRPLLAGSRELWRGGATDGIGWEATIDTLIGGKAWRSVTKQPFDRWAFAVVRSPLQPVGWQVEAGTWLSFRYWASGFGPDHALGIHLKPADESNFAAIIAPVVNHQWQTVRLRLDRDFRHRARQQEPPAIGETIHGIVWIGQRVDSAPIPAARFWISDLRVTVGE